MGQAQFYIAGMTDLSGVIGAKNPTVSGTDTLFNYFKRISDYVDQLEGYTNMLAAAIGTAADDRDDETVMGWLKSSVKSIQTGSISMGVAELWKEATITSVNLSKSMLVFLGTSGNSIEIINDDIAFAKTGHHFARLVLTSSTKVTAYRTEANSAGLVVSFQVVEFY